MKHLNKNAINECLNKCTSSFYGSFEVPGFISFVQYSNNCIVLCLCRTKSIEVKGRKCLASYLFERSEDVWSFLVNPLFIPNLLPGTFNEFSTDFIYLYLIWYLMCYFQFFFMFLSLCPFVPLLFLLSGSPLDSDYFRLWLSAGLFSV